MQMVVILGFVLVMVLSGIELPFPPLGPWWVIAMMILGYLIGGYLLTKVLVWLGERKMKKAAGLHKGIGKSCAALMLIIHFYLLAGMAGVMLAGWLDLVDRELHLGTIPLVWEMVLVCPFVLAMFLHWLAIYPLDRMVRNYIRQTSTIMAEPTLPVWSRREFLLFHIRYDLLFAAVPIGLIALVVDLLSLLEPIIGSVATMGMMVAGVGAIAIFTPVILVHLWRAKPLPSGHLRDRLVQLSKMIGFSFRDIVVWDSAGVVVNAAIIGFIKQARYVLISDAMLEHFSDDAIVAVFAHEAGHAVHHHIPYTALFSIGWFMLMVPALQGFSAAMGVSESSAEIISVILSAALWVGVFGLLSRRFEWQADVFAASIMSAWMQQANSEGKSSMEQNDSKDNASLYQLNEEGVRLFGAALQAVARLNGVEPSRRNFRHGSIRSRLDFLDKVLKGGGRKIVDRNIRRIKMLIWGLFILGSIVTIFSYIHSCS